LEKPLLEESSWWKLCSLEYWSSEKVFNVKYRVGMITGRRAFGREAQVFYLDMKENLRCDFVDWTECPEYGKEEVGKRRKLKDVLRKLIKSLLE